MSLKFHPVSLFTGLSLCLSASHLSLVAVAQAECYPTPQAAIAGSQSTSSGVQNDAGGYHVVRTDTDSLLRRSWVTVASCDHPEWPAWILAASARPLIRPARLPSDSASSLVVIHAGDPVRLWRQEAFLRIQVAGISEQTGIVGQTIRVRLAAARDAGSSQPEERSGIVQGRSDVEMRP